MDNETPVFDRGYRWVREWNMDVFTEADMDRAMARFGICEDHDLTSQHDSHDGFWRPTPPTPLNFND